MKIPQLISAHKGKNDVLSKEALFAFQTRLLLYVNKASFECKQGFFFCDPVLQFIIVRQVGQERQGVVLVVHLAAEVAYAVAHDEVVHMQLHVVGGNLFKHTLRYLYVRCLVFHNHPRSQLPGVEYAVGTQLLVAYLQPNLVGEECGRVVLVLRKEVYEVLSHPLFGGECDIFSAQYVPYLWLLGSAAELHVECGEVKILHFSFCFVQYFPYLCTKVVLSRHRTKPFCMVFPYGVLPKENNFIGVSQVRGLQKACRGYGKLELLRN